MFIALRADHNGHLMAKPPLQGNPVVKKGITVHKNHIGSFPGKKSSHPICKLPLGNLSPVHIGKERYPLVGRSRLRLKLQRPELVAICHFNHKTLREKRSRTLPPHIMIRHHIAQENNGFGSG